MGMNNSDFLSDAVALDLGKSGVKVAETLEIEVGSEWWRLINAAAVTEGKFYKERNLSEPVIVGDTIYTESIHQEAGVIPQTSIDPILFTAINGDVISIWYCKAGIGQIYAINHTTGVMWKHARTGSSSSYTSGMCYWDAPNARIVYVQKGSSTASFFGSLDVYGIELSNTYTSGSFDTDFYKVVQFPEIPNDVYSLWWVDGASPRIKKITCTVGANIVTQTVSMVKATGVTILSAITGVPLADGVFPFYSRTYSSVGVAWRDPATGIVKYVLETDSWGTIYSLPDIAPEETTMTGFGNLVLRGETEMFVAQFDKSISGNMVLDAGYSFPANFVLLGATRVSNTTSRIWGAVGSTLYSYTLTHTTMRLVYNGVVTTSWTGMDFPLSRAPICIAKQGDLELLLFQYKYCGKTSPYTLDYEIPWDSNPSGPDPVLCIYNSVTNSFVALWDGWNSSAVFPTTYNKYRLTGMVIKCGEYLLFIQISTYSTTYIEVRKVSISSILNCADTAALNTLIVAGTRKMVSGSSDDFFVRINPTRPGQDERHSLFELKNNAGYVLPLTQAGWQYEYAGMNIIVDPVSLNIVTNAGMVLEYPQYANYCVFGVQGLLPDDNFSYYGDMSGADDVYDGYYRLRGSLNSYFVADATWTRKMTSTYTTHFSVQHGGEWRHKFSMAGKKNESLCYGWKTDGTGVVILGGSIDGDNLGGHVKTYTLPFNSNFAFLDERSNVFLVMGTPSGSTFPYWKITGVDGGQGAVRAVRLVDNDVYDVDMDISNQGGLATSRFFGSWISAKTMTGKASLYSTFATIDEGVDDPVGEDSVPIIYSYDTKEFIPYPFAREGIRAELSNISKTTKITLPETQDNLIRGMLAAGTDFRGSRCILRRVFPDHLDEVGSDIVLLDGYIQDWSYVPGKKGIAFSVSKTLIDVGAQFPKRLMNMGCSHVFKGARCRYLGEEGRCLKTRAFCTSLGNINQFGGFPWVAARQRRVMWK